MSKMLTKSSVVLLPPQARHAEDRVVLLSDVWLDRPDILDRLHTVFAGGRAAVWTGCKWRPWLGGNTLTVCTR